MSAGMGQTEGPDAGYCLMSVHTSLGATRVYAVSTSLNKLKKVVALGADMLNSRTEDCR